MLDPTVRDKLRDRFRQLEAEGKIVPRAQLDQYFATFRARFGPDRLAALDGEPLLEAMHGQGGKDSLAYWLEFKNDDESRPSSAASRAAARSSSACSSGRRPACLCRTCP